MPGQGLQGKKFIGKIVEGFDPQQRGRYYVHIPDLMPHVAESEGMLCPNATHSNRASTSSSGKTSGASMPLKPGFQVEVVCETDDISSARIVGVVSDDQPKSDASPGKLSGAEPTGKVIPMVISGLPRNIPFGSAGSDISSKFGEILNSGGAMAQQLFSSVKDKLGPAFDKISESFKPGETPSPEEANFQESLQSVDSANEANAGASSQFDNATVDDAPIGENNTITEEEKTQGYIGNEDEIIDKFLGPKEGINSGD